MTGSGGKKVPECRESGSTRGPERRAGLLRGLWCLMAWFRQTRC